MVKKFFSSLKKDGLIGTIKKIFRFIRMKFAARKHRNVVAETVDVTRFSTVIVFENNFGWNHLMKQRPQQIAEHLPADTLMFYHSHYSEDFPRGRRIVRKKENLVLIDLGYYRDVMLAELAFHKNKYVMVYSTDFIPYDRLKLYEEYHYTVLYEYVDDLNEMLSGKEEYARLKERHDLLLQDDIIVTATATRLYENIKKERPEHLELITNGGDYDHFRYREYPVPDDLQKIKDRFGETLCYYGALAGWFDYGLIKAISAKRPETAIVLIGMDYDHSLGKSGVCDLPNVFFLGKKTFDQLPAYGCNIDVFLIPFLINEITLSTSPVKLFEYMAMEKPIVTTALPECRKYRSVLCSENTEEFLSNIEIAFEKRSDPDFRALLAREAKENEWSAKADQLVKFANRCRGEKVARRIGEILQKEAYDRIVVWRSTFGWDVPLFQRPQHISRQLARKGCLVFYEVTQKTDLSVFDLDRIEERLYLSNFENFVFKQELLRALAASSKPKYLQIYSTNWQMGLEELEEYRRAGFTLLYEYIDDINPDLAGTDELPQYVKEKYDYAMEHTDALIVTTAKDLYEDVRAKRGTANTVMASNGVDYPFFRDLTGDFRPEADFLRVIGNGKINVCYYGALAKWFDYELIRKIDATGRYNIILFGVKYDASYDQSGIGRLKNVHFFGAKDYKDLKYYASRVDILTIPFVINSITQATSPLKLFEYMALHKPIVTTAMNECKKYASVLIGEDHDGFLRQLERCPSLAGDETYLALLDREARENDWSAKADSVIGLMRENERG